MGQFGIGQGVRRVEDKRLLTGEGHYTDDERREDEVYLTMLRSPHAHAEIADVDTAAAREAPGVLAVYTIRELDAAGIGDIPCLTPVEGRGGHAPATPGHPVLARGRVRHVGDPVVAIVAETLEAGRDAAELVEIDYAPLDHVVDTQAALGPEAPRIWEEAPGNLCQDWDIGDEAAVDAAFEAASHVTRLELVNNRIVANSLEPRNALGEFDAASGTWTLTTGSQGVFSLRKQLAQRIFKVEPERIRVVTPDVGGGFGMKIFLYAEQVLVLHAAREVGRPVKWSGERTESFQSDAQGRDHVTQAALAFDRTGAITALKIDTIANLGAYLSNFGLFVATSAGARMYPGVYRVPALHGRVRAVFTNTVPVDAYRGAGRPEAAYLVERLIDVAARELGMTPAELRRRNFVAPEEMPHETLTGMVYDSGDFTRLQGEALRLANADGLDARKAEARRRGRLRGLGHASYIECCAGPSKEEARFRLEPDGGVSLFVGTQSNGQGHATAYAQFVADRLGLSPERIAVRQGDSTELSSGGGTGGSRSLILGGGAILAATDKAVERMKALAGYAMEVAPADLEFEAGTFVVAGTDKTMSLAEVAAFAHRADLPEHLQGGVDETADYAAEALTFPNGCHVCELEIDEATGEVEIVRYVVVDDIGTVMNPLLLLGQIHGGTVQGIGQALHERTVYEDDSGQLVTATFMDYTLPRADHVPNFEVHFVEDIPCRTNPWGLKGAGEAGAIGAPPAVINAVVDALQPYGVRHVDMPATPERIWEAIRAAEPGKVAK